jgi:hypothetical protein
MNRTVMGKALVLLVLAACDGEDLSTYARGRNLHVAELSASERAKVYTAALRGAFDLSPNLSLLVDTAMLARTGGDRAGSPLGMDVRAALNDLAIVQGECAPERRAEARTPVCRAALPGYVVRFSDVFAMPGDTVQTHILADRYDTPSTGTHQRFRFEQAFQLVRSGAEWRVVRKARIDSR